MISLAKSTGLQLSLLLLSMLLSTGLVSCAHPPSPGQISRLPASAVSQKSCIEDLQTLVRRSSSQAQLLSKIESSFRPELRKKVGDLATLVNGYEKNEFYTRFFVELEKAQKGYQVFLGSLRKAPPTKTSSQRNWAYLYPDRFGVDGATKENPSFAQMIKYLDYWKDELNVDVLYFLPFNKSPQKDFGYDVSDYKEVLEKMGGKESFKRFAKAAREKGINVVMDFVPGHVSDAHPWFKKAKEGDPKYLKYFLSADTPPPSYVRNEGENVFRVYLGPNGEYKRQLLFPDVTDQQWNPSEVKGGEKYFYSSFYPFQKDLNLQNPDVFQEHLSTISHWMENGVGGFRVDAISWWVKQEGTEGVHSKETFALSELMNTFIQEVKRDDAIYLPEMVGPMNRAMDYVNSNLVGSSFPSPSGANTLFAFPKVVQILNSAVSGDFAAHNQYMKSLEELRRPDGYEEVLYLGNHHDEIYIGFLPQAERTHLQKTILEKGGVVYKNGTSAGAMVSDLLDHDLVKMKFFYKWFYGHYGSKALYQGVELGSKNEWEMTYHQTKRIFNELIKDGKISADAEEVRILEQILSNPNARLQAPPADSPLRSYIDGRLLHRASVEDSQIEEARRGKNELFNYFQSLTNSQRDLAAFAEGAPEEVLDTLDSKVGSFVRRAYDGRNVLQEIAVLKNGTASKRTVRMNLSQLTRKKEFRLRALGDQSETQANFPFIINRDQNYVEIEMQPHETLWLETVD